MAKDGTRATKANRIAQRVSYDEFHHLHRNGVTAVEVQYGHRNADFRVAEIVS